MKPLTGLLVLLFSLIPICLAGESVVEHARIHVEAIGGVERLAGLKSMRAEGTVSSPRGGEPVDFVLVAAPQQLTRTESKVAGNTQIIAHDGQGRVWQAVKENGATKVSDLPPRMAALLVEDSQFFDPLTNWVARGFNLEDAGTVLCDEGIVRRIRVGVTGKGTLREVWLDTSTYLIVRELTLRRASSGEDVVIETRYGAYRPVDGILFPHLIQRYVQGRLLQETKISRIEINVPLAPHFFEQP